MSLNLELKGGERGQFAGTKSDGPSHAISRAHLTLDATLGPVITRGRFICIYNTQAKARLLNSSPPSVLLPRILSAKFVKLQDPTSQVSYD